VVHPSRFGQIAAVAILGLLSMCVSAQAQLPFSSAKNVSNNGDFSMTPQVGVDAAGNIYVVWEDDTTTTNAYQIILFSRSTDGGANFSTPKPVSNASGFATNPRISVDRQGGINVVWQDNATTGGNYDVFFSRSSDGGQNFSAPTNLSSANDPGDSTSPQIATDASGNIDVVWEEDSINLGVFFSHSTNGGGSFSPPMNLSPNSAGASAPQIAVGVDGSINLVWQDTVNFVSVIFFSRSVDGGANFSTTPTNISNDSGNSFSPQIALDSNGNINIVWVDDTPGNFAVFFKRSDNSASFKNATINVSNNPVSSSPGNCDRPQIGVDAKGNIELVWQHNPTSVFTHQVFSARSTDGGTTFSIPQNRSNDSGDATKPWLTVDGSGGFNLGWQDTTVPKANIFFTQSVDTGATFSAPQNLSKDSGASSDMQIVADKNGNLDVVWSDDGSPLNQVSGVNQILFSRFTNPQQVTKPPVANAGLDQTLECAGPGGTTAILNGSASSDTTGQALSFVWTDETNNVVGTAAIVKVTVAMGTHTFTLVVTDAGGVSSPPATTHVTVQDTMPPTLSVSVSPSYLWPPNHKLVQVTATVTASDVCGGNPTVQLVSITSSDPLDSDDIALGTDARSFFLSAERSNPDAARVYTITYRATDASGHATLASATVTVSDPGWYPAKPRVQKKHKKDKEHEHDRR
jgi:hypothetical protein